MFGDCRSEEVVSLHWTHLAWCRNAGRMGAQWENNGHRENSHRLRAKKEGSGAPVAHLLDRVT